MKAIFQGLAMILLLLSSGVSGFAQEEEAQFAEKLKSFREQLQQYFSSGNVEGILSLCEEDSIITWQDGTIVKGIEGHREYYQDKMIGESSPVRRIEFEPEILYRQVNGNTIISHGYMHDVFYLKAYDTPLKFNSVFTAVLVDTEQGLKLRSAHLSLNAFDNPLLRAAQGKQWLLIAGLGLAALVLGLLLGRASKKNR